MVCQRGPSDQISELREWEGEREDGEKERERERKMEHRIAYRRVSNCVSNTSPAPVVHQIYTSRE